MPTYAYQCQKCGEIRDEARVVSKRDDPADFCQKCGNTEVTRMFTTSGNFILKGDGWHNTQYNKTGRIRG